MREYDLAEVRDRLVREGMTRLRNRPRFKVFRAIMQRCEERAGPRPAHHHAIAGCPECTAYFARVDKAITPEEAETVYALYPEQPWRKKLG